MIGNQHARLRSCRGAAVIGGTYRVRGLLAMLAMLAVSAVSACSSSGSGAAPSSTHQHRSPSAQSSPSISSSPNGERSAGPAGRSGSPADAATVAAIKSAYRALFSPGTPIDKSVGALQNGAAFRQALIEQGKSPMAKQSSAAASQVRLLSPDLARVTYSILLAGTPVLQGQTGYAVREDGTWKVADKTFCGLLALNGSTPAACKQPGATTLPGTS